MPSFTFCTDWFRAAMLAFRPLAMARPAASSAPLLMREPEDSWKRVFCRLVLVMLTWFCAINEEMLLSMLTDMVVLLFGGPIRDRWIVGSADFGSGPVCFYFSVLKRSSSVKEQGGPEARPAGLLQQSEHTLLRLVGLRQSGDAGLRQDLELRHIGDHLRDVGGGDAVQGRGQVLHLRVGHRVCPPLPI